MEILQSRCDFSSIEPRIFLANALVRSSLQRSEELSATAVLHTQVQMIFGLERVVKRDDEGVIASGQNFLFGECSFDLISLDHFLLAQNWNPVSA
jgi:hypothetical protein